MKSNRNAENVSEIEAIANDAITESSAMPSVPVDMSAHGTARTPDSTLSVLSMLARTGSPAGRIAAIREYAIQSATLKSAHVRGPSAKIALDYLGSRVGSLRAQVNTLWSHTVPTTMSMITMLTGKPTCYNYVVGVGDGKGLVERGILVSGPRIGREESWLLAPSVVIA